MIKTEKIILKKNNDLEKWLFDSTAIYNQCFYFLRQEYFLAIKENRSAKYNSVNEIYHLIKTLDCWKKSNLDIVVKQSIIRQCHSNWFSTFRAFKKFNKDKKEFLGKPKLPKYLKNGKTFVLSVDKLD